MVQEWPQKDKLPPTMQTHWDSVIFWWAHVALAYWQLTWKRQIHYSSGFSYWPFQIFWSKRSERCEISEIFYPQQDTCRKKKLVFFFAYLKYLLSDTKMFSPVLFIKIFHLFCIQILNLVSLLYSPCTLTVTHILVELAELLSGHSLRGLLDSVFMHLAVKQRLRCSFSPLSLQYSSLPKDYLRC